MNQKCKVCGEPAAGFHFGAFTCEGCKSFFGRSYNNLSSISECKNNGECVINKKNRTACKSCRLRKCLLVGMSKSGSRYGRRSNWFKIHCLLQEQQQAAMASLRGKTPPDPSFTLPFPPPFLHQENSSSSPDSESSEKGPSSFIPMHFPSMFLRPSPFLIHPQMFPYPPTPPIKPEPPYSLSEHESHSKTLLNNNNYDSKNNNLENNSKRFYLDAILGLKSEKSPSPSIIVTEEEEQDVKVDQDAPIDLSVRSRPTAKAKICNDSKQPLSSYHREEVKTIPLDLSV